MDRGRWINLTRPAPVSSIGTMDGPDWPQHKPEEGISDPDGKEKTVFCIYVERERERRRGFCREENLEQKSKYYLKKKETEKRRVFVLVEADRRQIWY